MKKLKLITIELLLLILTAMAFLGFYKKEEYRVRNLIPEYKQGMNYTDQRLITMTVSDEIKETLIYDAEGNLVEEEQEGIDYTEENGYKRVEAKVNDDSILTEENYEKVKNIVLNRLNGLGIGEYTVELDKATGQIKIRLQETDNTDMWAYYLNQSGKLEITDAETGEVLLDESHIKDVGLLYGSNLDENGQNVSYIYLQIAFDKDGTAKLDELSKIYIATTEEVENEDGEKEETTTEKKVAIYLNGTNMGSTVITNIIYNDAVALCVGSATDNDEYTEQSENATNIVKILRSGTFPIEYTIKDEEIEAYSSKLDIKFKYYEIAVLILTLALYIVLIIRFKERGLITGNLLVGFLAATIIMLRLTNVVMTNTAIIGIALAVIIDYMFLIQILKSKGNFNEILIKHFLNWTPTYIITVIIAFSKMTAISSFGMALIWGAMIIYIYNLIFTKSLIDFLKEIKNEKK